MPLQTRAERIPVARVFREKAPRSSAIKNTMQTTKPAQIHGLISVIARRYTIGCPVFCRATWEAPMFGRWPLCHQRTMALAM